MARTQQPLPAEPSWRCNRTCALCMVVCRKIDDGVILNHDCINLHQYSPDEVPVCRTCDAIMFGRRDATPRVMYQQWGLIIFISLYYMLNAWIFMLGHCWTYMVGHCWMHILEHWWIFMPLLKVAYTCWMLGYSCSDIVGSTSWSWTLLDTHAWTLGDIHAMFAELPSHVECLNTLLGHCRIHMFGHCGNYMVGHCWMCMFEHWWIFTPRLTRRIYMLNAWTLCLNNVGSTSLDKVETTWLDIVAFTCLDIGGYSCHVWRVAFLCWMLGLGELLPPTWRRVCVTPGCTCLFLPCLCLDFFRIFSSGTCTRIFIHFFVFYFLVITAGGQEPMMSVLATEDQASWGCKRTCQKVPPGMGAFVRSLWAI